MKHQQELLKRIDAWTTRGTQIASTIRATLWKNSVRNVLKNITDGIGYEGIIEFWDIPEDSRDEQIKS